jgi:hypothetical protein
VSKVELPNVAAIVARVLERVAEPERPLLVAIAERLAAERYRGWAGSAATPEHEAGLLGCADREEEIARRIETLLGAGAAVVQRRILEANADLEEINRSVFAGRPLAEQFAIQAQGERSGAALWRQLAKAAAGTPERETYLACAALEEESARYLESLLAT